MTDITEHPIFYWHDSPGNTFRVDVADFDEAAECPHCVPVYSAETVDRLRARVAELESASINEGADEIDRLRARVTELEAEVLAEREACAKVCETEALRRTTSLAAMGAKECATAIRARASHD